MRSTRQRGTRGFSLIETMIVVAILVIVTGAIFSQLQRSQTAMNAEAVKVDLTQQQREFLDQVTRDLHLAGYPSSVLYTSYSGLSDTKVAAGVVKITPTSLWLEGDASGDGNVYVVKYTYDSTCSCIYRTQALKASGGLAGQTTGTAYVAVENVLAPATAGEALFTYFQSDGTQFSFVSNSSYDIENDTAAMKLLKVVKVNLSLRNTSARLSNDSGSSYAQVSMTATAMIGNQAQ